jgi:hypothetical protein
MATRRSYGCVFLASVALLLAAIPSIRSAESSQALTERINQFLEARWSAAKAQPAADADDAEFLRRVYLDLVGTIPPVSEVRAFLEDRAPDKRARLVERLLGSPGYVTHFSHVWRSTLLPENVNVENLGLRGSFETWLQSRLRENKGYDRMVREILAATPQARRGDVLNDGLIQTQGAQVSPVAFYLANESKPENLAGSTARLFLAVKLECAQCHNHPHADWKQEQFWAYAAFFGPAQGANGREIRIPKTGKMVQAQFPDGAVPAWKGGVSAGTILADWMTREENPYFARAAVNRVWAYFFGVGLVEPVDDLSREGENNALLDDLARAFVKHQYDLKYLIRAIVLSRPYQLSSVATTDSQEDVRIFARMPLRALSPEQIFESLIEATGIRAVPAELAGRFARQNEKPTEVPTSILQALALMNGKYIDDATSLERSETLAAVSNAPFLDSRGKIETLCLSALGRKPRADESARLVKYLEKGGPSGDPQRALADIFWVLLNSAEFLLNH